MNVLIFKTDVETKKEEKVLRPMFNENPTISKWTIDKEDIDNVLRIECHEDLSEKDVIVEVKRKGFYCEVLSN